MDRSPVTMGHRALVAYERADDRYDVHYSHWGAALDLVAGLTRETPFGGPVPREGPRDEPAVDPDPIATGVPFPAVVADHLDFVQHEALYVVRDGYDVAEYRVLPFLIPTADGLIEGNPTVGRGVLLEVTSADPGSGYVLGWFDGVRDVIGELVDRGVFDPEDVVPSLETRVRRFAGLDRDLILDPAPDRDGE